MRIDHALLPCETLNNLASAFVSQVESSDYDEMPFLERVAAAIELIKRGEIVILFSDEFQVPFLLPKSECINRFGSVPKY